MAYTASLPKAFSQIARNTAQLTEANRPPKPVSTPLASPKKTASQLFRKLTRKANFSNQVSSKAFIQAQQIWKDYIKTVTAKRNAQDIKDVLAQLVIVNNQVHWGYCKIEPTQWHNFCELFYIIKDSADNGTIVETLDDDAPKKEAA